MVDDNFEHTEPTSARYMQQILEGMQYVHKQNIVHLDLKPENIVCVDTTGTKIKIIDFGLASKLGEFPGFRVNKTLPRSLPLGGSHSVHLLDACAHFPSVVCELRDGSKAERKQQRPKTFCGEAADDVSLHH